MKTLQQAVYATETKQINPLVAIDDALQQIFKSSAEETKQQKARVIMGAELGTLSDEELEVYLTEFQHLIDNWLDTYEQQLFGGLTLRQMLGQG